LKLVETATKHPHKVVHLLHRTKADRVYQFPLFTSHFCERLVEELSNFEASDMPKGRPNTMNNYGVLLDELGFNVHFFNPLRTSYLSPVATALFPEWVPGTLDSHKAFTVKYDVRGDVDLNCHYDDAEVSVNVSLGCDYEGGSLFFGGMLGEKPVPLVQSKEVVHPQTGWATMHRGRQFHGAMPVEDGCRRNVIMWTRSSQARNRECPMCGEIPHLVKSLKEFGGGFTRCESYCSLV